MKEKERSPANGAPPSARTSNDSPALKEAGTVNEQPYLVVPALSTSVQPELPCRTSMLVSLLICTTASSAAAPGSTGSESQWMVGVARAAAAVGAAMADAAIKAIEAIEAAAGRRWGGIAGSRAPVCCAALARAARPSRSFRTARIPAARRRAEQAAGPSTLGSTPVRSTPAALDRIARATKFSLRANPKSIGKQTRTKHPAATARAARARRRRRRLRDSARVSALARYRPRTGASQLYFFKK
eukprot:SAG31_NODE_10550_length_1125_cov_7.958090_1_plen_243_part_00